MKFILSDPKAIPKEFTINANFVARHCQTITPNIIFHQSSAGTIYQNPKKNAQNHNSQYYR